MTNTLDRSRRDLDLVFVVGAGRSGTTWVQEMLGCHPAIVTGQESHIFPAYAARLWSNWRAQLDPARIPGKEDKRCVGIPNYVTEEEFIDVLRTFVKSILFNIAPLKPEATILLEKTPRHAKCLELISRCFPQAKVIHVIRDGRAVVSSLLAAARGWGRNWAASSAKHAAFMWRDAVNNARHAAPQLNHYLEVRYESLIENGCEELQRVLDFLDIRRADSLVHDILAKTSFDKMKRGTYGTAILRHGEWGRRQLLVREPEGFHNRGQIDSWKETLSRRQLKCIYRVAGPLLVDLGYLEKQDTRVDLPSVRLFKELLLALGRRTPRKEVGLETTVQQAHANPEHARERR